MKKAKPFDIHVTWPQQSPIDLGKSLFSPELPTITFNYPTSAEGEFNPEDHNFYVAEPHLASINYAGIDCPLVKLHFHKPSEHAVAGNLAHFEVHLIHKVPVFPESFPSAYIVVGVLFDAPARRSRGSKKSKVKTLEDAVIANWFTVRKRGANLTFDPNTFLPPDRSKHYRYEGSLTTPPFSEFVSWIVMQEHAILDTPIETEVASETEESARDLQPINRRFILRDFQ
jgi:carbonic anhydrase